jgi:hypothetical protein
MIPFYGMLILYLLSQSPFSLFLPPSCPNPARGMGPNGPAQKERGLGMWSVFNLLQGFALFHFLGNIMHQVLHLFLC